MLSYYIRHESTIHRVVLYYQRHFVLTVPHQPLVFMTIFIIINYYYCMLPIICIFRSIMDIRQLRLKTEKPNPVIFRRGIEVAGKSGASPSFPANWGWTRSSKSGLLGRAGHQMKLPFIWPHRDPSAWKQGHFTRVCILFNWITKQRTPAYKPVWMGWPAPGTSEDSEIEMVIRGQPGPH